MNPAIKELRSESCPSGSPTDRRGAGHASYAETGNAVFDAGYLALSDHCKGSAGPRRLHVVSAPAGGGKTSYSYALMLALTSYADQHPDAPYGCVFVVDQIKKA